MTQAERDARTATEKDALMAAMLKLPFNLADAGATRIAAWEAAHEHAQKVLRKAPRTHDQYVEARLRLQACGGAPVSVLAIEMHGTRAEKQQAGIHVATQR